MQGALRAPKITCKLLIHGAHSAPYWQLMGPDTFIKENKRKMGGPFLVARPKGGPTGVRSE